MAQKPEESDEQLLSELREVAKRGLDDPPLLIDLHGLLALPAVAHTESSTGGDPDSPFMTARCAALASTLRALCAELSTSAEPDRATDRELFDRAKVLDGLFMLKDEWKGTNITNRREKLAGVDADSDTSTFRRSVEEPIYRLLLLHLRQQRTQHDDAKAQDRNLRRGIARLVLAGLKTARMVDLVIAQPYVLDSARTPLEALDHLLHLQGVFRSTAQFAVLPAENEEWWEVAKHLMRACDPTQGPLSSREVSSCLAARRQGRGPFQDYLEDHPRGIAAFEKWHRWLGGDIGTSRFSRDDFLRMSISAAKAFLESDPGPYLLERSHIEGQLKAVRRRMGP